MSVPQAVKMSASKLIHYLSSHPAAFGIQASLPSDNITLNPGNKRTESLSDFQTGIGAAVYATLDTEWHISHTKTAVLDTVATLHDFDGGVIAVSEVYEQLTKIRDILDNALFK